MRAILREVAKCRALLGEILGVLGVFVECFEGGFAAIGGRLDAIDAKLAELAEGPDQSSVTIDLGPVSEQRPT